MIILVDFGLEERASMLFDEIISPQSLLEVIDF